MAGNVVQFRHQQDKQIFNLNLPAPRIWTPQHLAEFLGVSTSWVLKRTQAKAKDPIPRIVGVGRLRFDTESPRFQDWMRRQLGYVDIEVSDE
jgi:hypothetical protein